MTAESRRKWIPAALAVALVAALFVAYRPALHGGPVWDDEYMLTENPVLRESNGLWRIWFDLRAVPVYYPLTLSLLWAECRAFGLTDLTGYHVVNVVLHVANALLLWRLLARLGVRGAYAVAAIWALHPVAVESVAWITETKNTLSALFYLLSIGALLRSYGVIDGPVGRRSAYALAVVAFALALAAKTTAVTLPAAAVLLVWWKRGRLRPADGWPVVPFVLLAATAGALTQWVEVHYTAAGQWDAAWDLTPTQRALVAGRAAAFYAGKLAWPAGLSFAYRRWTVDPGVAWQWAFPAAWLAVGAALWAARRRLGRGPLVGVLFFIGTLAPALGFFRVYYQHYSFVADHFQYTAGVGLIAVAVAAAGRLPPRVAVAAFVAVAIGLTAWTADSAGRFASDESVWAAAVAEDSTVPHAVLGYAADLVARGEYDRAVPLLRQLAPYPDLAAGVAAALGAVAEGRGDFPLAVAQYGRAVSLKPAEAKSRFQLGTALLYVGRNADAVDQLRAAVGLRPDWAVAHDNLGYGLLRLGRVPEAAAEFHIAERLDPTLPLVKKHLEQAAAARQ